MKITHEGRILLAVPLVVAVTVGVLSQCAGHRYSAEEESPEKSVPVVVETTEEVAIDLVPTTPIALPPPPLPCAPGDPNLLEQINRRVTYPGDRVAQLQQFPDPDNGVTYVSGNWYNANGALVSANDVWVLTEPGTLFALTPQARERSSFEQWNATEDLNRPSVVTVIGCVNSVMQREEGERRAPLPSPGYKP